MENRKTQGDKTDLRGPVWTRQGSCVRYQARGTGSQSLDWGWVGVEGAGDGMAGREPHLKAEDGELKKVIEVGQELSGAEPPQFSPSVLRSTSLRTEIWAWPGEGRVCPCHSLTCPCSQGLLNIGFPRTTLREVGKGGGRCQV